jgi:hypothetical protein
MAGLRLKSSFALAIVVGAVLASPSLAKDKGAQLDTERDANALQMAADACRNQEFSSLLQAMAISDAVVTRYSARTIAMVVDGVSTPTAREDYHDFPIGMIDYYWISRASMQAWESNSDTKLVHLQMEFNQSQSDQWRIDWVPVRYDGKSSGGDDLGEVAEIIGAPGHLLFETTADCWELVEHNVGAQ